MKSCRRQGKIGIVCAVMKGRGGGNGKDANLKASSCVVAKDIMMTSDRQLSGPVGRYLGGRNGIWTSSSIMEAHGFESNKGC